MPFCIEKGCVVNSIYHYPTNMAFFTTPELLEIGDIPMTSLNDKPNRDGSAEVLPSCRRSLQAQYSSVRDGLVRNRQDGAFVVSTRRPAGCRAMLHGARRSSRHRLLRRSAHAELSR